MPYLGHPPSTGEENNFKILDDISSYTLTFDGSSSSVVSTSDETIYSYNHRFVQGQRVTYNNGGGGNIAGLTSGTVYYIIKQDHNNIQLATSAANAASGTAVNITAVGTGASHTLNVAFDGTNTKFKATHTTGQKARITRGAQLVLSINGVIQQPHDSSTPSTGFGFDVDGTIIFSEAPASTDAFWGHILTNNNVTFDISDNKIDHFTGDGSTLAFTLSKSPPNNENILVTIDGVVQYPNDSAGNIRSYSTAANVISFTSAPGSGTAIEVRHIGFAGATSGGGGGVTGFYGRTGNAVLKSTDHITTGNIVAGVVTATNAVITGDLTVNGTTTTLDTNLIGVDRLEVDANNTTVAVAVTQSGAGDLVRLFDSTTEKLRITDDGLVGIGTNNPQKTLNVFAGVGTTELIRLSQPVDASVQQEFGIGWCSNNNHTHPGAQITSLEYDVSDPRRDLLFYTRGVNSDSAPTERLRITSAGNLKLPDSAKIELGGVQTGSGDLQIWHDGSHSRIHNDTGHLLIETDAASAIEINKGVSENLAKFIPDGAVELYYDAVKKVETTTTGIDVTGAITADDLRTDNSQTFYLTTANDFRFRHTGGTERLRITSGGNVNIGTGELDQTDRMLNVYGGRARISGIPANSNSFEVYGNATTGQSHGILVDAGTNSSDINAHFRQKGGATLFKIRGDGNIGVGTDNPTVNLHSYHATTNTVAKFESGDSSVNIRFKDGDTTNEMGIGALGNDFIVTATSGGERLRIASNGVLTTKQSNTNATSTNWNGAAINIQNTHDTDNNASVLAFMNSAGGGDCAIQGIHEDAAGSGGSRRGHLQFGTSGANSSGSCTERLRIASDGYVAIGGYGDPNSILDVRENKDAAETMIRLFNTDNGDTDTQTAAFYMSPDSRGTALTGLRAIKENASFATNAGRDVSLTLNTLQNNSQVEALRITSGGQLLVKGTSAVGSGTGLEVTYDGSSVHGRVLAQGFTARDNYGSPTNIGNGMYSPAGDSLAFSTASTERLLIKSDGEVHITGGGDKALGNTNTKGNLFVADGGTAAQTAGEGGTISFGAWLAGDLSAPYTMAAIKGISESGTTNINTGALIFATREQGGGPYERLRITSGGNIIPGTNNATNIGDGSTNFNSIWASTRFRGNDNVKLVLGSSQNLVVRYDGSNNIIGSPVGNELHIKSGTGDNDSNFCAKFIHGGAVELYHNNNIKLNTRTDGVKITGGSNISMNSSGTGQLFVTGNGYTGGIALDGDAMHIYHNSSSRDLVFGTNENEKVRIKSATGGVHINNTFTAHAAADDLVVGATSGSNGMTILSGVATGSIFFNDGSGNEGVIQYVHSGAEYMRIKSEGFLKFDVGGGTDTVRITDTGRLGVGAGQDARAYLDARETTANTPLLNLGYQDGSFYRNLGTVGPFDDDGTGNSGGQYLHVKLRTVWNDASMTMFRITGYYAYSDYTESYAGCYRYNHSSYRSNPYGQLIHNQKRATLHSMYNTAADPGYLVLVLDSGTNYIGYMIEHNGAGGSYGSYMQQDLEILEVERSSTTDVWK